MSSDTDIPPEVVRAFEETQETIAASPDSAVAILGAHRACMRFFLAGFNRGKLAGIEDLAKSLEEKIHGK